MVLAGRALCLLALVVLGAVAVKGSSTCQIWYDGKLIDLSFLETQPYPFQVQDGWGHMYYFRVCSNFTCLKTPYGDVPSAACHPYPNSPYQESLGVYSQWPSVNILDPRRGGVSYYVHSGTNGQHAYINVHCDPMMITGNYSVIVPSSPGAPYQFSMSSSSACFTGPTPPPYMTPNYWNPTPYQSPNYWSPPSSSPNYWNPPPYQTPTYWNPPNYWNPPTSSPYWSPPNYWNPPTSSPYWSPPNYWNPPTSSPYWSPPNYWNPPTSSPYWSPPNYWNPPTTSPYWNPPSSSPSYWNPSYAATGFVVFENWGCSTGGSFLRTSLPYGTCFQSEDSIWAYVSSCSSSELMIAYYLDPGCSNAFMTYHWTTGVCSPNPSGTASILTGCSITSSPTRDASFASSAKQIAADAEIAAKYDTNVVPKDGTKAFAAIVSAALTRQLQAKSKALLTEAEKKWLALH